MYKVAVVGSGPSGLMAALQLSKVQGIAVHLIEKNDQIGKKVKASGGGMCNYTQHAPIEVLLRHYGDNGQFLKHAFKQLDAFKTEALLSEIGIVPLIREDGKVFPASLDAKQWLGAFESQLRRQGVQVLLNHAISALQQGADGFWQLLSPSAGELSQYDAVILAIGGASYPGLGTAGDGYPMLEALGQVVNPPKPALSGIVLEAPIVGLEGISVTSATLSLHRAGQLVKMAGQVVFGPLELLITHKGLSGPLILNSSRWYQPGDRLVLNWLGWQQGEIERYLLDAAQRHGKRQLGTVLGELPVPSRLMLYLLGLAGVPSDKCMAELSKSERLRIVSAFTAFDIGAFKPVGISQAMATAGGLSLSAVSGKTMAVKGLEGLYVVGELLDIDGDTGGYNIQAALTTGYAAAMAIIKSYNQKRGNVEEV